MNKLDYCFHTHTFRCGHAQGEDEEMVLAAKAAGIKTLGFSDHVMIPGINQKGIRGNYSLYFQDYVDSINALKAKYKGDVDIKLGFEAEWFDGRFKDYYKDLLENKGFDYLVLGEHCTLDENDVCKWYGLVESEEKALEHYTKNLCEAYESGLFKYSAHPDHFMLWYPKFDENVEKACHKIAKCAAENGVILEINLASLRHDALTPGTEDLDAAYPKLNCWKIFAQYPIKVAIGYDAHNPNNFEVSLAKDVPYAFKIIKDLNLNFVDANELFPKK